MRAATTSTSGATPYRAVWRWHFYAGLLVAPVLLVLAVTGALYLWHGEIDRAWYRELLEVAPSTAGFAPVEAQEAAVRQAAPAARLHAMNWPRDATHAASWSVIEPDGRKLDVVVDPYRATVVGTIDASTRPMDVVRSLHGSLLLGRAGGYLVELVACWTMVMLATGIYLWWPRRWKLRGVVVPRLGVGGRRFWRDLHAVPAIFNALLVGFLVLSGLPWSAFWGEQVARFGALDAATAPTPNFGARPTLPGEEPQPDAAHRHEANEPGLPWSIRQSPVPAGGGSGVDLASVMRTAAERGLVDVGPTLRVFYPDGPAGVYTVSLVPARAQDQRTLYVDPRDGRVLHDIGWNGYSPLGRAVEWGVMAHMGSQFGAPNRWLALAVCVGIVLTLVTGVILWWRRKPDRALGAPDARGQRLPRGLVATMVAMGVLLPLAGASMLAVLGIERALRGRRGA